MKNEKKQITMTRKEAEVLMFGMDFAVGEIGEPECRKCRKASRAHLQNK